MSLLGTETSFENAASLFKLISYDSFDTKLFRQTCKEKGMTFNDICTAITIYLGMGSNFLNTKRVDKAIDVVKAKACVDWLKKNGIYTTPKSSKDVTLPRIAKSFAPITFAIRKKLEGNLKKQVDSDVDISKCDLAFVGFGETVLLQGCDSYGVKFSTLIGLATQKGKTEEQLIKQYNTIKESSKSGLSKDQELTKFLSGGVFKNLMDYEVLLIPLAVVKENVQLATPLLPTVPKVETAEQKKIREDKEKLTPKGSGIIGQ
jgi:hypothetical protein